MGRLVVMKSGLFTSLQDGGRRGYRKFGVPESGCMDQQSARLANLLINNPENAPLLEITHIGPELIFDGFGVIALTGANLSPVLNGKSIPMNTPIHFLPKSRLIFGQPKYGVRCYLAMHLKFTIQPTLGSFSQYGPLTEDDCLDAGDYFEFLDVREWNTKHASVHIDSGHFQSKELEAYPGPEWNLLTKKQQVDLVQGEVTIGENNRMGYQLQPEKKLQNELNILTSPVIPGTVQLTPGGTLIALMRDGQVTGGYPRVLQLSEESINRLAQKPVGMRMRLKML